MSKQNPTVPAELIEQKIYLIRGHKVMLDRDLAALYRVPAIALRQQVKRNPGRFPKDFFFQLTKGEAERLVSQNVIPSRRSFGGSLPYAFTQEGVAMLSRPYKPSGSTSERRHHAGLRQNSNAPGCPRRPAPTP